MSTDEEKPNAVPSEPKQNADATQSAVFDPYPDLPGDPSMAYNRRVGLKNLLANKAKNFSSDNQPATQGRKPGRNRATVLTELLGLKVPTKDGKGYQVNPLKPEEEMTTEVAIMVALVQKALKGDVRAIQEIQDTVHGKIKETVELIPPDVSKKEVDDLTDEEAKAAYESALKG